MKKLTQPLKWHGGKGAFNGKLAKWITLTTWNLILAAGPCYCTKTPKA